MFAVIQCFDNPARSDARKELQAPHKAHLTANDSPLRLAGPLLNEAGNPVGSLLIVETESLGAAEDFVTEDPFAKGGVFKSWTVFPFKPTINSFA